MPRSRPLAFALLLATVATTAAHAATGDKVHGEQLFQEKGCAQCHGANRRGTEKGPDLSKVHKHLSDAKIRDQIVNGGGAMPPFGDAVSEAELQDLIAFLHTKPAKAPKAPKTPPPTPPAFR